jgi:hypothetical protein
MRRRLFTEESAVALKEKKERGKVRGKALP